MPAPSTADFDRLRALCAIGGIDATRLQAVLDCSVGSVAVVRALVETSDPETTARAWMAAMP